MATLTLREVALKCLRKSGLISLREDIFSISDIPSPKSLKRALEFIREFRCPPAAPTNLRITEVRQSSILLAWDDNADNEDGFEIVWRGRRPFYRHDDGSKKLYNPNRESFSLTGLNPEYEYCVRVRAFNKGGNSQDSNEDCATIPPSPSESPPASQGVSQVAFFNCHDERLTIHIWMLDLTAGSFWSEQGSLPSQWQGSSCLPTSPFIVSLPDEHSYLIIAVDPDNPDCGENNPQNRSCQRQVGKFFGKPGGLTVSITVQ